ncbi:hypothetical protein BGZ97_011544, partial [Linnemannia gamsii]
MALSFPLNNAPYGLVAIAAALNASEAAITLKPVPAETSTTTSLIPQGTSPKPVKISGQVAIARYLVRSLAPNSLYTESDLTL